MSVPRPRRLLARLARTRETPRRSLPGPAVRHTPVDLPDSHDFVALSDGLCHYRVEGPSDGEVALLVHGATVPAWEFDRLVPYLSAAGFRTVRADLFGHGYSDRPRVRYEHALFVRQLAELLDALSLREPVHVLGHSLGAAVGARLLHRHPERIKSVILAAPLVNFTVNTPATRLLSYPLLGECLMPTYVMPLLIRRRTRRYRVIEDGRFVGKFRSQLQKPGFSRALLSLFRSGSLGDQSDCYRALGQHPHPVLVLRGVEDPIVTAEQIEVVRALVPHASYREIGGTAHAFFLTHPETVAPLVADFFRRASAFAADAEPAKLSPRTAPSPST